MAMDEIRIRMQGKKDTNQNDYYVAVTDLPISIDLSNTVFVLFPDEEDEGRFGGDLVVRKYRGEQPSRPRPKRHPVKRERTQPVQPSEKKSDG
jgi:hypothetical protein